ncbi:MAG: GAF domain-containing protein [Balneolaceae bacterium]
MGIRREEKALGEFKLILQNVLFLMKEAMGVETAYLVWVNRSREQFVLETHATSLENVMFQDRVGFSSHFLSPYKDLQKELRITVGEEVQPDQLRHYYGDVPVTEQFLIPFLNNRETVALTVLETASPEQFDSETAGVLLEKYNGALVNVLNTYLELTDLYDRESEWIDYEESLNRLSSRLHKVEILKRMLDEMQALLTSGSVCLIARGNGLWTHVLSSEQAVNPLPLGIVMDENSLAYDALQSGEPEFAVHFNRNPKRISSVEPETEGATLAIPILIDDRRHGLILVYDSSPLAFKESTKHKLINLVRTASLSIRINLGKLTIEQDLLTADFHNFIPDLWERALLGEISRLQNGEKRKTWFGMCGIGNVRELRTRFRLDDLKRMQRRVVQLLSPSGFGLNGYVGFHSDYIYTFILQGDDPGIPEQFLESARMASSKPLVLSDGQEMQVDMNIGLTDLRPGDRELNEITARAKAALSGTL